MTAQELVRFERLYKGRYVYLTRKPAGDGTVVTTERFATKDGRLTFERTGLGMDCSHFTERYLIHDGYDVPYLDTKSVFKEEGKLESKASRYLEQVSDNDVEAGDLVYFAGHVGIVTKWDPETASGQMIHMGFEGGVTKIAFDKATGAFGEKRLFGFARPLNSTRNVEAASERLSEYQWREIEAVGSGEAFVKPTVEKSAAQIVKLQSKPPILLAALGEKNVQVSAQAKRRRRGLLVRVGDAISDVFEFWTSDPKKAWRPDESPADAGGARTVPAPSPQHVPALRRTPSGRRPVRTQALPNPNSGLWGDQAKPGSSATDSLEAAQARQKKKEEEYLQWRREAEARKARDEKERAQRRTDEEAKRKKDEEERAKREKEQKEREARAREAALQRQQQINRDEEERRRKQREKELAEKAKREQEVAKERKRKEDQQKQAEKEEAERKLREAESRRLAATSGIARRNGVGGGYGGGERGGRSVPNRIEEVYDRQTGEYLYTKVDGVRVD